MSYKNKIKLGWIIKNQDLAHIGSGLTTRLSFHWWKNCLNLIMCFWLLLQYWKINSTWGQQSGKATSVRRRFWEFPHQNVEIKKKKKCTGVLWWLFNGWFFSLKELSNLYFYSDYVMSFFFWQSGPYQFAISLYYDNKFLVYPIIDKNDLEWLVAMFMFLADQRRHKKTSILFFDQTSPGQRLVC